MNHISTDIYINNLDHLLIFCILLTYILQPIYISITINKRKHHIASLKK